MSSQEVKFRVRIRDKSLTRSAYATAESGGGYRTLYLSLARGDNRNGTWETSRFVGASDAGKWRITSILTVDYDGYRYEKRGKSRTYKRKTNRKGRATVTVTMPASQLYVSAGYNGRKRHAQPSCANRTVQRVWAKATPKFASIPSSASHGDSAPKTVEVELRDATTKKVLKGQPIEFNWWRDDVDQYRTVKINSKGRASVAFAVPRGGIRVGAYFTSQRYDYVSVARDIARP